MKKLLHYWGHKYHLYGYEHEDIMQELEVAKLKAEREWKPDGGANFKTYLTHTVQNHFATLCKRNLRFLYNPECPPPETSYRQEPSFTMQEFRKLFEGVKHEKTRAILLHALDLVEKDADVEPSARGGAIAKAAGVSGQRVQQMLSDVRKTPAFRKFREELYA